MAVIFIGAVATGIETLGKYGTIIYTNREQIVEYVENFGQYAKDKGKGFLVHTELPPSEDDKKHQDWVIFSTGSNAYPLSGSWHPA
jgi:hypothetical protein